jgi:hypothetical protein
MAAHKETVIPAQSPYIPMLKITPSYICGFYSYQGPKRKVWQKQLFTGIEAQHTGESKETTAKAYTGEITKSSRKKLQSACDLLFALAKRKKVTIPDTGKQFTFRIGLITLTLSGMQGEFSDKVLKKELLEPFIRHFRIKGMVNYIWKAERQGNGNLHFHILTDCWVDKNDCRNYWNKLQAKLGLIEQFYRKHGHRNPNSTDCKAVKSQEGMTNYMLKYMLKKVDKSNQLELGRETTEAETGKVWDCSLNLKLKNDTAEPIEDWQFELMQKAVDSDKLRVITLDHCTVYFPKGGKMWEVTPNFLSQRLIEFLKKVRAKGRESRILD